MNITKQIVVLFISITILVSTKSCKDNADDIKTQTGYEVGQFAPSFSLTNEQGEIVSLSSFRGKTVLIEFWASWCSYCNTEAPKLNTLYSDYKDSGFEIIGVSIDEDKSAWVNKTKKHNHQYTQVNDPAGWNSQVVADYGVETIPKMILVNENGQVLFVSTRADKIREQLQHRLK